MGRKLVPGLLDHQRPNSKPICKEKRWCHGRSSGLNSNPSSTLKIAVYLQPIHLTSLAIKQDGVYECKR